MIIRALRNNIGTITAVIGMIILVVLTYGDLGELFTEAYWENVGGNLTAIGALSIGLSLTQWSIKQGVGEQALQAGLNREVYLDDKKETIMETCTPARYNEHRDLLKKYRDKDAYLVYFLEEYNLRETARRRAEILTENGFRSEDDLLKCGWKWWQIKERLLVRQYRKIRTNITSSSIKWSTTEIVRDRFGRIQKLDRYRAKRAAKGLIMSSLTMIGMTFIAGGLFLDTAEIPLWQKTIKLGIYIVSMALTSVLSIIKNYEKGAFGVSNELAEINNIWYEFGGWTPSEDIIAKVEKSRGLYGERKNAVNSGTTL